MNNYKDNKNINLNSTDANKKTSLPLIVGTSAMIIASVISLDQSSISLKINALNSLNSACYVRNDDENNDDGTDNLTEDEDTSEAEDSSNDDSDEFNPYMLGDNGELFYDSSVEDDKFYYGKWGMKDVDDDDDEFIIW